MKRMENSLLIIEAQTTNSRIRIGQKTLKIQYSISEYLYRENKFLENLRNPEFNSRIICNTFLSIPITTNRINRQLNRVKNFAF